MSRNTSLRPLHRSDEGGERSCEVEVKKVEPRFSVTALRMAGHRWHAWLSQPVHASSLGVFRVVFSVCMYWQACHFDDIFEDFASSKGVYPYPGLGWIQPVGPEVGNMLLRTNKVAAMLTGIGLCTRAATVVLFLTFTYIFLLCESNHNNHYILICHVTFVASFLEWGQWCSVDMCLQVWRHRRRAEATLVAASRPPSEVVPYWHLLLMQLLFSIPYFFGSIAKLNEDWLLRAQPLKMWLAPNTHHVKWVPFGFGSHWLFPWSIAWGGFAFDLGIVFLLFLHLTRYGLAFPAAVFFNCSNKLMFNIGIFPYAMLGSLHLFCEPCLFARLAAVCHLPTDVERHARMRWHRWWMLAASPREHELPGASAQRRGPLSWAQCGVLLFVGSFCAFHALYPLRCHVIYPAGVSWHEEGHLGAWHMKLRSKHGWVALVATEANGRRTVYAPSQDPLVNGRQKKKILSRPHALLLYSTSLARTHLAANRSLAALRAYSCFSLNARAPQPLFNAKADLLDHVGRYELLPPLHPSAVGTWLTGQPPVEVPPGAEPVCSLHQPMPQELVRRDVARWGHGTSSEPLYGRAAFESLHQDAGLRVRRVPDELAELVAADGSRSVAYTMGWHRVSAELADYLESRPRLWPGADALTAGEGRRHTDVA